MDGPLIFIFGSCDLSGRPVFIIRFCALNSARPSYDPSSWKDESFSWPPSSLGVESESSYCESASSERANQRGRGGRTSTCGDVELSSSEGAAPVKTQRIAKGGSWQRGFRESIPNQKDVWMPAGGQLCSFTLGCRYSHNPWS